MLRICPAFHGGTAVIGPDPSIRIVREAIFLPRTRAGDKRGLFEPSGRAVAEGLSHRGVPQPHTPLSDQWTPHDGRGLMRAPAGPRYVYLGETNRHYGHFLIGPLARLWSLGVATGGDVRFVMDEDFTPETLFETPHVRTILTALGLSAGRFVRFPEGCVFDEIVVPAPSFEENSHVHAIYGALMARLGDIISPGGAIGDEPCPPVVFLTKQNLAGGIWRLRDEAALGAALQARGAAVVAPETLPLAAQIALWRRARRDGATLVATTSSALHTAAFVPGSRIVSINNVLQMWTNQVLIDRVAGSRAMYVHDPDMTAEGPGDGFLGNHSIADPQASADALMGFARDLDTLAEALPPLEMRID